MNRKTRVAHITVWIMAALLAWGTFSAMHRADSYTPPRPVDIVNPDDYQLPTL